MTIPFNEQIKPYFIAISAMIENARNYSESFKQILCNKVKEEVKTNENNLSGVLVGGKNIREEYRLKTDNVEFYIKNARLKATELLHMLNCARTELFSVLKHFIKKINTLKK